MGYGYTVLAEAPLTSTRRAVLSKRADGGYTLAQQLTANDGGVAVHMFMKGAIHIADLDGVIALRDALDCAISEEIDNRPFTSTVD